MRRGLRTAAAAAGVTAALAAGAVLPSVAGADVPVARGVVPAASFPHMDHVFVIMMENSSYASLLSPANADTSYIRQLAADHGLATDYYGVTHVSTPNYVAAVSGNTWGSNSDDPNQVTAGAFNHVNLVDQLDQAGVSWKGYMQSLPSVGFTGASSPDGLYVRKHDPFMMFPDVANNPSRADHVVPLGQLAADLSTGHVPQFAWISPNVCDDMHGGATNCPYANSATDPAQATLYRDGNDFLKQWVTAITTSRAWTGHSAIFITWDEGAYAYESPYGPTDLSGCCDSPILPASPTNPATGGGGDLAGGTLYGGGHVPMIVVSRLGERGRVDSTPVNHYSLLRTIEANWDLGYLGNAGDSVQVHSLAPLLTSSGSGGDDRR